MTTKNTGGSVDYYSVHIQDPTTPGRPEYTAECNDIIEALGMDYAEGNAFKAIWRKAAARTLGIKKQGYDEGLYDSEKTEFFGHRMKVQAKRKLKQVENYRTTVEVATGDDVLRGLSEYGRVE